jgi:hypothetical protein
MIAKTYILANLKYCDRRFRGARSAKEGLFYAKLAILELCGWIEMSMDDVVIRCSKRRIKLAKNAKLVQDQIVDRTYGFDYERHFRSMLIRLIGLVGVEKLEKQLDPAVHSKFVSTLVSLKTVQDTEAHTYVKGVTKNIDAPSVTLARFTDIYAGMTAIDQLLKRMRY